MSSSPVGCWQASGCHCFRQQRQQHIERNLREWVFADTARLRLGVLAS